MSQKVSNLESEERERIKEHIEGVSTSLGMNAHESYGSSPEQRKLKELLGMCSNCQSLSYCSTEFGNVHAVCTAFVLKLNGQNRIVECNLYEPRNVLSLNEMYSMAILIDPDKENNVGFTAKIKSKKK